LFENQKFRESNKFLEILLLETLLIDFLNISIFSGNIIFDVFFIKRYILLIWAINRFLKKTNFHINNLTFFTFIDNFWLTFNCLLMIIEEMSTFLGILLTKKGEENLYLNYLTCIFFTKNRWFFFSGKDIIILHHKEIIFVI